MPVAVATGTTDQTQPDCTGGADGVEWGARQEDRAMSLQEIKQAIAELPAQERAELMRELKADEPDDVRAGATESTAHEKAKHLIGPGSGLGDLASNPAYMEGYGEDSLA